MIEHIVGAVLGVLGGLSSGSVVTTKPAPDPQIQPHTGNARLLLDQIAENLKDSSDPDQYAAAWDLATIKTAAGRYQLRDGILHMKRERSTIADNSPIILLVLNRYVGKGAPQVKAISLENQRFDSDGAVLQRLPRINGVVSLNLVGTGVDWRMPQNYQRLAEMRRLKYLELGGLHSEFEKYALTNDAMDEIARRLTTLETLAIKSYQEPRAPSLNPHKFETEKNRVIGYMRKKSPRCRVTFDLI